MKENIKIGLALGSGAARGIAHIIEYLSTWLLEAVKSLESVKTAG